MKLAKRTVLICLIMTLFSGMTAFASEGNIDIETYEKIMKEEYLKYGIDYEINSYEPDLVITLDMLNNQLKEVEAFSSQSTASDEIHIYETIDCNDSSDSLQRIMPVKRTITGDHTFQNKLNDVVVGYAMIRFSVDVTMDANTEYFISIDGHESYQYGIAVNFDSWTETGFEVLDSPGNPVVRVHFTGRLSTTYTEPNTGISATLTQDQGCIMHLGL